MSTGSTGSVLPKWQLAVLLGAPIAIGIGYLYFRKQTECLEDDPGKKAKKLGNLKGQTISLDGDEKLTQEQPENIAKKVVELSPLEAATAHKNEGNICFKKGKYDEAIEWYDKAIQVCPATNAHDLSTFYQNRAAAYEQLKKWSSVRDDCTKALELNSKYVKALHRRARAYEHLNDLSSSLEDVTATCILESFQNNSTLAFADRILKQMGSFIQNTLGLNCNFLKSKNEKNPQVDRMHERQWKPDSPPYHRRISSGHTFHHSHTIRSGRSS